ncbi:MAG: YggT family protein [Coriobacteriia bacterium]|nr:YggT family protein [Actinomycetota bacterium]MDZ4166594.1 YggT family protein [Coriobacteriia bacterium]
MTPLGIIVRLIDFYQILIIVYVLMSWIRPRGLLFDIYRTLGTIVEPWLGIFRRIIPPLGMMDISPIVAIVALSLIQSGLRTLGA